MIGRRIAPVGRAAIVVDEANEAQRRMGLRIQKLLFQRGEATPQDVRFGQPELVAEPVEQLALGVTEIDLDGCGLGNTM